MDTNIYNMYYLSLKYKYKIIENFGISLCKYSYLLYNPADDALMFCVLWGKEPSYAQQSR